LPIKIYKNSLLKIKKQTLGKQIPVIAFIVQNIFNISTNNYIISVYS